MISLLQTIVVPPLIASIVSASIVALLLRGRVASLALDVPNERSLHATPVPRIGGIGILAGIAAAWGYTAAAIDPLLLLSLAMLIGVSLLDDLKNIGVAWRLMIHLCSSTLAVVAVLPGQEWWWMAVAALATAWMINLYNFMDGADGLAGVMAVFGFGSFGVAALMAGDGTFAGVNFSIAAAASGFLCFNLPPARVFMGDAGSIPLGFLAAVCALAGWQRHDWPLWFGAVTFSPFIVDATLTLCRRLLRGAKIWQAHREHYYQRLVRAGWGHRTTLYAESALMGLVCTVALAAIRLDAAGQVSVVAALAIFYVLLIAMLERKLGPVLTNA